MSGTDRHDYRYPKTRIGESRSRNESWKMVIKAMYHGGWMTIPQLQAVLRVRRPMIRKVLKGMVDAEIMETKMELSFERSKGKTEWLPADASPDGKPKYRSRDGFLPRNHRYYRLMLDKITIQVEKKDPSK